MKKKYRKVKRTTVHLHVAVLHLLSWRPERDGITACWHIDVRDEEPEQYIGEHTDYFPMHSKEHGEWAERKLEEYLQKIGCDEIGDVGIYLVAMLDEVGDAGDWTEKIGEIYGRYDATTPMDMMLARRDECQSMFEDLGVFKGRSDQWKK